MTAEDYLFSYTKGDKPKPFTFREFVFFEIEFISKRVEDEEC